MDDDFPYDTVAGDLDGTDGLGGIDWDEDDDDDGGHFHHVPHVEFDDLGRGPVEARWCSTCRMTTEHAICEGGEKEASTRKEYRCSQCFTGSVGVQEAWIYVPPEPRAFDPNVPDDDLPF